MVGVAGLREVDDIPGSMGITLGRKTIEGLQEECRRGEAGGPLDMETLSGREGRAAG